MSGVSRVTRAERVSCVWLQGALFVVLTRPWALSNEDQVCSSQPLDECENSCSHHGVCSKGQCV
mgnify:CR=1 FL=1